MMKAKKGFTIVELLVGMAIFLIVTTLALGGFIAISRLRTLSRNMVETQQKMRIALEMVTRLSFQAQKIRLTGSNDLELYYNINDAAISGSRFVISGTALQYYECPTTNMNTTTKLCTSWGTAQSLTGDKLLLSTTAPRQSGFSKSGTIPSILQVNLYGNISEGSNPFFQDNIDISTKVILTNLK